MPSSAPHNRRRFIVASLATAAGLAGGASVAMAAERRRPTGPGLSIAGAEFGTDRPGFSNVRPGRFGVDYTYNSAETVDYFADRGFTWLRLPVRWERLQPRLSGPLDPAELARVRSFAAWCRRSGVAVVLDLHNYARFHTHGPDGLRGYVVDERVRGRTVVDRDDLADLWVRLSRELDDTTVRSFGLMNEPHDMGRSDWRSISRHVATAVRAAGDTRELLVAGDGWSNAHRWQTVNGDTPWIDDPGDNVVYEAHCYLDRNASGKYVVGYDAEAARDPNLADRGPKRLQPFLDWCRRNRVRGVIGECGVPADPRWRPVFERFTATLAEADQDFAWWAAGEWWDDYPLSLQPRADGSAATQLTWIPGRRSAERPSPLEGGPTALENSR